MRLFVAIVGFAFRRWFVRFGEMLLTVELADAWFLDGLRDAVWSTGHFAAFTLISVGASLLIDLFIEVTRPKFQIGNVGCDSDEK